MLFIDFLADMVESYLTQNLQQEEMENDLNDTTTAE